MIMYAYTHTHTQFGTIAEVVGAAAGVGVFVSALIGAGFEFAAELTCVILHCIYFSTVLL